MVEPERHRLGDGESKGGRGGRVTIQYQRIGVQYRGGGETKRGEGGGGEQSERIKRGGVERSECRRVGGKLRQIDIICYLKAGV